VRGGLDDALDKLARRDELRRRAAGEATGTPPAVQELVEAIAGVVNRNPKLAVTVGVEGAGDPMLLHFAFDDGVVQVNVDNTVAARVAEAAPAAPKHADFDIDLDDPADEPPPHAYPASAPPTPERGQETRRISYDDRDRYDPGTGYPSSMYGTETSAGAPSSYPGDPFFAAPAANDRRYQGDRYESDRQYATAEEAAGQPPHNGSSASSRPQQSAGNGGAYPPHPFAATPPPPVPPQTSRPVHAEQHRASDGPSAAERAANQRSPEQAGQRGMPTPLPEPIPLKVDSEETELAAKRLAALLRDNPTLLRQATQD
jgi:hypothetical protein